MKKILLLIFLLSVLSSSAMQQNNSSNNVQNLYTISASQNNKLLYYVFGIANNFLKSNDYVEAREYFEKIFTDSFEQDEPFLHAHVASVLGLLYRDGLGGTQDYKKAIECFNIANNFGKYWSSREPAHEKTKEFREIYISTSITLGEIYATRPFSLDNDYESAIKLFKEALEVAKKYKPEICKEVENLLKNLELKDPVDIILTDKTIIKFDLQSKDPLSQKSFHELMNLASAHSTEFIIARVMICNENNKIGSFYCEAKTLIPWLWGPTAPNVFCIINEEAILALNTNRRSQLEDGRKIVQIRFFKWNRKTHSFEYLFNDKEILEGYSGRLKRVLLVAQDYNDLTRQAITLMVLGEMYFLGLGSPKNLKKACYCLDLALKNKKLPTFPENPEIFAKKMLANIWLDIGVENIENEPKLAIKYLEKASLQEDNFGTQIIALTHLMPIYNKGLLVEKSLKKELECINKILNINKTSHILPRHLISILLKKKKDIETEISNQSIQESASSSQKAESSHMIAEPCATMTNELNEFTTHIINAQKVESLLKIFHGNLSASQLKGAREALEKIESLEINDDSLQIRVIDAFNRFHQIQQPSASSSSSSSSSSVAITKYEILDDFNQISNIPENLKNSLKSHIDELTADPFNVRNSEQIKSLSNTWRIRIGDYRILYVILPKKHSIGIIKIDDRKHVYDATDEDKKRENKYIELDKE